MRNLTLGIIYLLSLSLIFSACTKTTKQQTDVLIVGGGASGISAGIQAARMGSHTLMIEESTWLGGMLTSAGVSAIDGNYKLPSGFWGEFRDSLVEHYGHLDSLKTGWVSNIQFEPSVANKIFKNMASKEDKLNIYYQSKVKAITKIEKGWQVIILNNGIEETIDAQVVIDATELGDIAKLAGVNYSIGMDSKHVTGEDIAPEKANNIVQDLTYVAILKDYKKDVTIEEPESYDASQFACAAINDLCINPKEPDRMWARDMMITYGKLPNNKYMINWPIEGNDFYINLVEMNEAEREEALKKAKNFTMQFVYFIQKELGFSNLGLADDEFPTKDLLPLIPYHRESRRIHGEVLFGLNHITAPYTQKEKLYRTTVAVGDYPVDHHHTRYHDYENLPNLYFHPIPSYGLPLGTMIPKNVDDLIVAEKSISVTNLVNGTTRLQPVVLQIGQAAGALASLAVQENKPVREVSVRDVQRAMLENGAYILPYLDVEKSDKYFLAYQRIGATGILKGIGKNVEWSNETWLRVNDPLRTNEIEGLKEFYDVDFQIDSRTTITYPQVANWIEIIAKQENIIVSTDEFLKDKDLAKGLSRGEFAIMIDALINPFDNKDVDLRGNIINHTYHLP